MPRGGAAPSPSKDGGGRDKGSSGAGVGEAPSERPLSSNASLFSAALLGDDDVDVAAFMKGCRAFGTTVLPKLGSFTTPAMKQIQDNMAKVESTFLLNPERFRSMRALLEEEKHSQMHSRMDTSGLADPSAAMGLLWARRGLRYWVVLFEPLRDGTGDAAVVGYDEAMRAYDETIGPFNGWVMRNISTCAARVTPNGHGLAALAPTQPELLDEIRAWSEVVVALLERMKRIHVQLELEDTHRTI